jgi:O-antigen/teichoic acid export membrane protein
MGILSRFSALGVGSLGIGGIVQIASYFGIFLALFVTGRLLSPIEFGLYAGLTATASLAGSVFTFGVDKMLTNLAARHGHRRFRRSFPAQCQSALFVICNLSILFAATAAFTLRLIDPRHGLTLFLALVVAVKMVLGGHLRGAGHIYVGLIAIFSLQPLVLGIIFGVIAVFRADLHNSITLETVLVSAIIIELGFTIWFGTLAGPYRLNLPRRGIARLIKTHMTIATRITTWNLLAQSSLLSVAIVTATFSPIQVAQYSLACRVSQILLMPWNSGMQLLIPKIAQFDRNRENSAVILQIRQITRFVFFLIIAISLGFLIAGLPVMRYFFEAFNDQAFAISLVFVVGNIIFAYFGIGDQGLIATNRHRTAQYITMVSAGIAIVGYFLCIVMQANVIAIAIIMMGTMIIRQIWSEAALFRFTGIRTRFLST